MARRGTGHGGRRPWQPLSRAVIDPAAQAAAHAQAAALGGSWDPPDAVWGNDLYSVFVREEEGGVTHVSFHRHDRSPVRDWRHMQQIKNEVTSPTRWGLECYPDERVLMDTSNEYHLFVLPEGTVPPFGYQDGCAVAGPGDGLIDPKSRARQRPWQPGLTTGQMGQREATRAGLAESPVRGLPE